MSQFASLFKTEPKEETEAKSITKLNTPKKKSATPPPPVEIKIQPPPETKKRIAGKSSNAAYAQVLTYIKRDTHREVKKALLDDKNNRDLSELVEELLTDWLKKSS